MSRPVRFAPEAERDLNELLDYIASVATPEIADRYVDDLITYCEGLATFPEGGTPRDDIRPGLRTTGFRGRVVIAFATIDDAVVILGVFYGGRDYETLLAEIQVPTVAPAVLVSSRVEPSWSWWYRDRTSTGLTIRNSISPRHGNYLTAARPSSITANGCLGPVGGGPRC